MTKTAKEAVELTVRQSRFVPQRTQEDCGCAALAMLLHHDYEEVAEAWQSRLGRSPNKSSYADLMNVARHLGFILNKRRTSDGIRRVRRQPNDKESLWVVVRDGLVYCPTVGIYQMSQYPWQAWGNGLEFE